MLMMCKRGFPLSALSGANQQSAGESARGRKAGDAQDSGRVQTSAADQKADGQQQDAERRTTDQPRGKACAAGFGRRGTPGGKGRFNARADGLGIVAASGHGIDDKQMLHVVLFSIYKYMNKSHLIMLPLHGSIAAAGY